MERRGLHTPGPERSQNGKEIQLHPLKSPDFQTERLTQIAQLECPGNGLEARCLVLQRIRHLSRVADQASLSVQAENTSLVVGCQSPRAKVMGGQFWGLP